MPQSMSSAKHRFGIIVQRGLSQTTAARSWILRWVRLDRRDPLPWDRATDEEPW